MTRTIIIQQITPVFQKVFNDTALTLLPEHSAADFDKWDSINHVILIARIEKLMKINISTGELIKITTVGQLADLIAQKLAECKLTEHISVIHMVSVSVE